MDEVLPAGIVIIFGFLLFGEKAFLIENILRLIHLALAGDDPLDGLEEMNVHRAQLDRKSVV